MVQTFKKCGVPRVAWQIDPFGHSREQASLFAQMYFDGLFLGRIDWKDKFSRRSQKQMEFVWSTDPDINGTFGQLFTGVLPNTYSPPAGFCFDEECNDDPIVDDVESREYNVPKIVEKFIKIAKLESKSYATNNLIMTMGQDFNYHNANIWFKNLEKLMYYVNEKQKNGSDVNVFYSTPSCYLYSLNQANLTWSTKSDDFFPYSSDVHSYWTGYFTSRPALKYFERLGNNYLQIVKQLQFLSQIEDEVSLQEVVELQEAMGILQHHDAVAGTEKQHVAYDYAYLLYKAMSKCKNVINEALNRLSSKDIGPSIVHKFCFKLNISDCPETERQKDLAITLYNPLGQDYVYTVRLPVTSNKYVILDSKGQTVESRLTEIPAFILNVPERESQAKHELVFNAKMPKLGFVTYFAKMAENKSSSVQHVKPFIFKKLDQVTLKGKGFDLLLNSTNGNMLSINLNSGQKIKFTQKFQWYYGMNGNNNKPSNRASGAYIFRPNGTARDFNFEPESKILTSPDSKYSEVHQTLSPFIGQVIRVSKDSKYIEIKYRVGPLPANQKIGTEVITKFETNLETKRLFYTDTNGRHLIKRTAVLSQKEVEPFAANYYPINSRIALRDEGNNLQLTVLTDRSQGGSSLSDGALEIMIHRRLFNDDAFGLNEALNEPGVNGEGLVITGSFYIYASSIQESAHVHRNLAQRLYMAPLITFADCPSFEEYEKTHLTYFSELNSSLPNQVHILSMEMWEPNMMLLRLEHFFENSEMTKDEPKSIRVNLQSLFKHIRITGMRETTLSVNRLHSEAKRLHWETQVNNKADVIEAENDNHLTDFTVTLKPMQIRTLLVAFKSTIFKKQT